MGKNKRKRLEELARGTPRFLLLEDTEEMQSYLDVLNIKGAEHGLNFAGSRYPEEVYRLATESTGYWGVFLDVILNRSPAQSPRFTNGVKLAAAIKKVRGSSIDVTVMSGLGVGGEDIIDLVGDSPYIDHKCRKEGTLFGELVEIARQTSIKQELERPRFPRVYILAGESGAGKTSVAKYIGAQMTHLSALSPPTTRPATRPSDVPNTIEDELYQPLTREHMTLEEMQERARKARRPLIWEEDGSTLTRNAFIAVQESCSEKRHFYMIDLDDLERRLGGGNDVLVTIRNISALKALKKHFRERSHTIYLKSDINARYARMTEEKRRASEIIRGILVGSEEAYARLADTTINTDIYFSYSEAVHPEELSKDAIDHIKIRTETVIGHKRKTGYGVPPAETHAEYVELVERALLSLAGQASKLEPGIKITITKESRDEYQRRNGDKGVDYLSLVRRMLSATVKDVSTEGGIKRVVLTPTERLDVSLTAKRERPWGEVLKEIMQARLRDAGFTPSQTGNVFSRQDLPSLVMENKLVYAETDMPTPAEKGQHMPYRLELIFT